MQTGFNDSISEERAADLMHNCLMVLAQAVPLDLTGITVQDLDIDTLGERNDDPPIWVGETSRFLTVHIDAWVCPEDEEQIELCFTLIPGGNQFIDGTELLRSRLQHALSKMIPGVELRDEAGALQKLAQDPDFPESFYWNVSPGKYVLTIHPPTT